MKESAAGVGLRGDDASPSGCTTHHRLNRRAARRKRAVFALLALALVVGASMIYAGAASAAPITVVDDKGADDQPGQKDLNSLTVDYGAPGATTFNVKWNWDDTATSGANTRDGCALFDTDADGFANFALCVTVASNGTSTTTEYECTADNRTDRCAGPTQKSSFLSTASASVVANSDPFGVPSSPNFDPNHVTGNTCDNKPACYTSDTIANANVVLADFGGATATLLNVCSYPSREPNSDPSDCVFTPNSGFLTIVKSATPSDTTNFVFNASAPSAGGDSSWTITGSGSVQLISYLATSTLDLNEVVPAGWKLDSASCQLQGASTGTSTATGVDNFTIQAGLTTTCTFNDSQIVRTVAITKTASPTTYSAVGQVITYTIVATNTGNVAQNLTVSDPNVSNLTCTPTNGSSVAAGASMTCTATHTITQADLDAGSYLNTSCVDATGATQACDSETVTGQQNPHLAITKSASPTSYNAVGQVITYTIVASNDGNVTLHNVTVSDPNVSGLTCSPATPVANLAPGASITCTATHTITQADIDAGSYANTACVDDGAGGAAQACDTETVTGGQNPALTIDKTSTTTLITAAGQVVPYSYLVTNTGNVTLTGITVTDNKVASVSCPVTTLAPGASTTCTGSHTVTQAELDAGGNLTNVAQACGNPPTGSAVCATDTLSIPIQPPVVKGHIFHTGVTCSDFLSNNPSDELAAAQYSVRSGQVNSVAPGVMFYYISITAPSSTFTINVTQTNDAGWKPIPAQSTGQIILYESNCAKSNKGTSTFSSGTGTATISVTGATAGATYVVGIKYSLSGLAGQPVSSPFPTVTYSFATDIGGTNVPSSGDTIVISPKP
jgi:uncharacterized repeat protein (TIGR01451 family)